MNILPTDQIMLSIERREGNAIKKIEHFIDGGLLASSIDSGEYLYWELKMAYNKLDFSKPQDQK